MSQRGRRIASWPPWITSIEIPSSTAGIKTKIGNHTFRATGMRAYLKNGGTLEKAAAMANHASTRTTQLYDRRGDKITLDEIERVAIRVRSRPSTTVDHSWVPPRRSSSSRASDTAAASAVPLLPKPRIN